MFPEHSGSRRSSGSEFQTVGPATENAYTANRGQLQIPRIKMTTCRSRAFARASPIYLELSLSTFRHLLKHSTSFFY